MSGNILDKYALRQNDVVKKSEEETHDDFGPFGILRGVKEKAVMLECRYLNGNSTAFNYAYLTQASFDPSTGITLYFGGVVLRIKGQHLNGEVRPNTRLYESILRHRVLWIQESNHRELDSMEEGSVHIDEIEIDS